MTRTSAPGLFFPGATTTALFGLGAEIMGIDRYDRSVEEFLSKKRIAIWGWRTPKLIQCI